MHAQICTNINTCKHRNSLVYDYLATSARNTWRDPNALWEAAKMHVAVWARGALDYRSAVVAHWAWLKCVLGVWGNACGCWGLLCPGLGGHGLNAFWEYGKMHVAVGAFCALDWVGMAEMRFGSLGKRMWLSWDLLWVGMA